MKFLHTSSKKKTIYLHIGVPKTASSTIQKGLFIFRNKLMGNGYYYPKSGLIGTNHKNIFFELCSMPDHKIKYQPGNGSLKDLVEEIKKSNFKNYIISVEHFSLLKLPEINNLKYALNLFEVNVIVYLRRQDKVIQSGWTQNAKRMVFKKSLGEIISEELGNSNSVYHYEYLLNQWAAAFGKPNIVVRIFEPERLKGNIFHDFLYTCGIRNLDDYPPPEAANISPDFKTLGLIHEISNRLDFGKIDSLTRAELGKHIENYCKYIGWDHEKKFNAVDKETFELIMSHFQDGNNLVAREYLGMEHLFSKSFQDKEITQFYLNDITQGDLLDILVSVLNNFKISIQKKL